MASVGFSGCSRSPGSPGRYLPGLCVAVLGLCAAGWLALAPAAFGYRRAGAGLDPAAAQLAALRRAARAQRRREHDGHADARNPDPAQVLSELRALLTPLLAPPTADAPTADVPPADVLAADGHLPGEPPEPGMRHPWPARHDLPAIPAPRSGGLAAMESTLAGAELLITGCGEEEAW